MRLQAAIRVEAGAGERYEGRQMLEHAGDKMIPELADAKLVGRIMHQVCLPLWIPQAEMKMRAIADLVRDQGLLPHVSKAARELLEKYPDRVEPIIRRWIGSREKYANV